MNIRDLAATSLGNILEWFDFGLFIYFAPILGDTFFHTGNGTSSTLAAFGVFATGYICRPLGGILFGYFGDTTGRVKSLRCSMLLMSLATFSVGVLPSFAHIGLIAPVLFTLLRMLQGASAGGEYCGVMIYLAESAPFNKRGFITSFAGSGANLGFMLATLAIILLKEIIPSNLIMQWGWRIPFIFLGLIGAFIFYFRLRLTETKAYSYMKKTHHVDQQPLFTAFKRAPLSLLKIVGITCMSSTLYILYFGYMSKYLAQYTPITLLQALTIQSILLLVMLVLIPFAGMLGDRWGRKKILFSTCSLVLITAIPSFHLLLSQHVAFILVALGLATILSSFDQGNNLAAFVENCPIDVRYSGIGFAFNLGNAVFGGTAPLLFSLLLAKMGPLAPAYYLVTCSIISLTAIASLLNKKETSDLGFLTTEQTSLPKT